MQVYWIKTNYDEDKRGYDFDPSADKLKRLSSGNFIMNILESHIATMQLQRAFQEVSGADLTLRPSVELRPEYLKVLPVRFYLSPLTLPPPEEFTQIVKNKHSFNKQLGDYCLGKDFTHFKIVIEYFSSQGVHEPYRSALESDPDLEVKVLEITRETDIPGF